MRTQRHVEIVAAVLRVRLAADIANEMEKSGITVARLAKASGLPKRLVRAMLAASHDATLDEVAKVALALGCRPVLSFHEPLGCPLCGGIHPKAAQSCA